MLKKLVSIVIVSFVMTNHLSPLSAETVAECQAYLNAGGRVEDVRDEGCSETITQPDPPGESLDVLRATLGVNVESQTEILIWFDPNESLGGTDQ